MIHQPGSKVIDIVQGCITSDFELRFFYVHSPNFTLALAFSSNYRYRFNLFNRDVWDFWDCLRCLSLMKR